MNLRVVSWLLWTSTALIGADLRVSKVVGAPGSASEANVIYSAGDSSVTDLQFDVEFDPAILSVRGVAGPAAEKAQKTINDSSVATDRKRFLVIGLNENVVPDGVLVVLKLSVKSTARPGTYPIKLVNVVGTDKTAKTVPIVGSGGAISVQ